MIFTLMSKGYTDINTFDWEHWVLDPLAGGLNDAEVARRVRGLTIRVLELEGAERDAEELEDELHDLRAETEQLRDDIAELEWELGPEAVGRARAAIAAKREESLRASIERTRHASGASASAKDTPVPA